VTTAVQQVFKSPRHGPGGRLPAAEVGGPQERHALVDAHGRMAEPHVTTVDLHAVAAACDVAQGRP
jgi:hypothetical protein